LPHCHIITSTTHKTLRGPRGGIIMMGKNFENPWGRTTKAGKPIMMSDILNSAVFPGMQGGPLEHIIAAKAVAFHEALQDDYKDYTQRVVKNAQAMVKALMEKGYKIISDGTDNHLMLIDLRNKGVTGKVAEQALVKAELTVNKNMVPFDDQSPMITSGIRIGTAAITTRGLDEKDCHQIVNWIDQVITNVENDTTINKVKAEINEFMQQYPLYPEL